MAAALQCLVRQQNKEGRKYSQVDEAVLQLLRWVQNDRLYMNVKQCKWKQETLLSSLEWMKEMSKQEGASARLSVALL